MEEELRQIEDTSAAVYDTLQAAAQYLMGRGPAPDFDALDPASRDQVDELLPAIVELVGDEIVSADADEGDEGIHIDGRRLRQAREASALSAHELAVRASAHGKTIAANTIESLEAALDTNVDAETVAAIADVLGVAPVEFTSSHSRDRMVLEDIRWAHPSVTVELDWKAVPLDLEPQLRLVISDFGLVTRLAVLDIADEVELRSDAALQIAQALSQDDPGTAFVVLVAGASEELGAQIIETSDLRKALRAPDGDRLAEPRRAPLALADAIRYIFEEVAVDWGGNDPDFDRESGTDSTELAHACAAAGIAGAKTTKPRIDAKRQAFDAINGAEIAALQELLLGVQQLRVPVGSDFRESFERDLVGIT
jgi:transcriptional regulator with XRE-family HTH domain